MKALSLSQVMRCESAKHGRCRCRCGGELHGARRGMDESFFLTLPADDPHRATVRREKRKRKESPQLRLWEIFRDEDKQHDNDRAGGDA